MSFQSLYKLSTLSTVRSEPIINVNFISDYIKKVCANNVRKKNSPWLYVSTYSVRLFVNTMSHSPDIIFKPSCLFRHYISWSGLSWFPVPSGVSNGKLDSELPQPSHLTPPKTYSSILQTTETSLHSTLHVTSLKVKHFSYERRYSLSSTWSIQSPNDPNRPTVYYSHLDLNTWTFTTLFLSQWYLVSLSKINNGKNY